MIHYKRVQVESKRVSSITCNKCGRVVEFGEHDYQIEVDFTTIKNTYGYGSQKDGTKLMSHVCEPCMDAFYATFAVPPQTSEMVEWGAEPADPLVFIDEPA